MTREEARELAQAEISFVLKHDYFTNFDLDRIYHSNQGNLVDDSPKFIELFADYYMIQDSPLMRALEEK